jgi:hypothetical protein
MMGHRQVGQAALFYEFSLDKHAAEFLFRLSAGLKSRGSSKKKVAKKWSSCKKQAQAQKILKIKLRSWNRFMKDCMAK